uniref:methylmalonyl-CoA mutase family protein n=1 Tax=Dietzia sp. TaxID=1871616 RepID=UPI002FDA31F6
MAHTTEPNGDVPVARLRGKFSDWESDVVGILAKSSKKDPAELPADAWRSLIHTSPEGLEINPLYTPLDELPEQAAPGEFPFVRGGRRAGLPESGWHVAEHLRCAGSDEAAATNLTVLGALENGASGLSLDVPAESIPTVLDGVYLELAPIIVDAGARTPEAFRALAALAGEAADAGRLSGPASDVRLFATSSPETSALFGESGPGREEARALAAEASSLPETARGALADGASAHEHGATDAQELGIALAAAVGHLRALSDPADGSGLGVEAAAEQVWFRLAATPDQFATIAKFRAARGLWARVAEVLGVPDAGDAPQLAVTSLAASTRRDPHVNMLRSTVAAFAAGVGGAEMVTVREFDATLDGGLAGTSRSFARRMARNAQLLLIEESHLGHVVDPAGGSWYVEARTEELADAAWSYFQEIEALGGLGAAGDKVLADLEESKQARAAAVANRSQALTG